MLGNLSGVGLENCSRIIALLMFTICLTSRIGLLSLLLDRERLGLSDPYFQSTCLPVVLSSVCLSVCPHFQNPSSPAVLVGIC